MAQFTTQVSDVEQGRVIIRGYSQEEIMGQLSYAEGAYLTLVGRLPTTSEATLVNAMLLSLLDHGFIAATVSAARFIASGNPDFVASVAGGLLGAGRNTLSPEHSAQLIRDTLQLRDERGLSDAQAADAKVADLRANKQRVPGLGHPVHRDGDFRATVLFDLADELGLSGEHTRLYRELHAAFVRQSGRNDIPINIDGCLACLGLDLGLTAHQVVAFALLGVLPGLMAQVEEEIDSGSALKYIQDGEYTGEPYRSLVAVPTTESARD